jgi:precorrin-2 dehydrogenase / sirohydrochlorin ferrochelatase
MPGYPIELDLSGRTALVVGLGSVGRRKAAGLLAAGARVVGVDPAAELAGVSPEVERRAEPYRAEHLRGACLAFAAGPPEVNRRVVADAKEAGVWVSSASDPSSGDFIVPAVWRDGVLTLTISTAGASPALAAALRDRAAGAIGRMSGLASALAELRPLVHARLADPMARRRVLADWADPRWLDLWLSGGSDAVRRELDRRLDAEEAGPDPT